MGKESLTLIFLIYSNRSSSLHCDIKVGADAKILTSARGYLSANTSLQIKEQCNAEPFIPWSFDRIEFV